jgi:hypothetical protein
VTVVTKKVVGGITVLEAIWAAFMSFGTSVYAPCPSSGCVGFLFSTPYSQMITALAVLLLLDGILGFWGARFAFPLGALLSVVFLLLAGYAALGNGPELTVKSLPAIIGLILAVLGTVANITITRAKNVLAEQVNPMNLPVFG